MKSLTSSLGFLLVILGLAGYFGSADTTFIALTPSAFGAGFVLLSVLAGRESMQKNMLDLAMGLAVVSAFAGLRLVPDLFPMVTGSEPVRLIVTTQSAMFVMSLVYLIKAYQSYKLREKLAAEEEEHD